MAFTLGQRARYCFKSRIYEFENWNKAKLWYAITYICHIPLSDIPRVDILSQILKKGKTLCKLFPLKTNKSTLNLEAKYSQCEKRIQEGIPFFTKLEKKSF